MGLFWLRPEWEEGIWTLCGGESGERAEGRRARRIRAIFKGCNVPENFFVTSPPGRLRGAAEFPDFCQPIRKIAESLAFVQNLIPG